MGVVEAVVHLEEDSNVVGLEAAPEAAFLAAEVVVAEVVSVEAAVAVEDLVAVEVVAVDLVAEVEAFEDHNLVESHKRIILCRLYELRMYSTLKHGMYILYLHITDIILQQDHDFIEFTSIAISLTLSPRSS